MAAPTFQNNAACPALFRYYNWQHNRNAAKPVEAGRVRRNSGTPALSAAASHSIARLNGYLKNG
jgi:hypothetical protein